MNIDTIRNNKWFERIYKTGIAIKGFDGLVEVVAGLVLVCAPSVLHVLLSTLTGYALQRHDVFDAFIAKHIARLDDDLARSGLLFLVIFLIGHGIVKLLLVYCLLKEILWAYPYALGALVLFLIYQLYVLVQDPLSIGMWLFTILDVIIVWLVYEEYKKLKKKQLIG